MDDIATTDDGSFAMLSAAKINVFLEVLGKRNDGYHELETVMLRTNLCDVMSFAQHESAGTVLKLVPESVIGEDQFPLDDSNLIIKAANALKQKTGCSEGASIAVQKLIPSQAGLAGGSSNAATALVGLNRLWNLDLTTAHLHEIAASLGSDVNFFIEDCSAAICRGRGELVEPISVGGPFYFVAVHPGVGNSTPEVFSKLPPATSSYTSQTVVAAIGRGDVTQLNSSIFNRLTQAARQCNPAMDSLLASLTNLTGKPAFMSGSGSTCFVVATSRQEAVEIEQMLKAQGVGVVFRLAC